MLGRDIVFSCCDSALFLCRDYVTTEVSMSGPRRSRQKVRCCILHVAIGLALAKSFYVVIEYFFRDRVRPWAGILCCDKVFLSRDRAWSRPRVFMSRQIFFFFCRDRVGQGEEN